MRPDANVSLRESERQWMWVAVLVYVPMGALAYGWMASRRSAGLDVVPVWGPRFLEELALGFGATALVVVAAWCSLRLGWTRELEERLSLHLGPLRPPTYWTLAFCSGVGEELLFRGAIQGALGPIWATALFAAAHVPLEREMRVWPVFALVVGALFAGLTVVSGSLTPCIVAHVLVNGIHMRRITNAAHGPRL